MSLMRKRIIAIIAAALAIVVLGISLAAVIEYVDTVEFEDVDGTRYYARNKDGEYKLYAKGSKQPLETTTLNKKIYYVTSLGTLVSVDAETGAADDYIPVETEGNENVGFNDRVLIFPHIEKKNILSLEVHNEHGTYTFVRVNENLETDADGDFIIKGSPLTSFSQELFAELYVGAGYTLTLMKIKNPIKRASDGTVCSHESVCDCGFSEYGLVAEKRERDVIDEKTGEPLVDEETGETKTETYDYEPAYYILTDTSGNRYKLIVGDMLVTGGGYYVQYVSLDGSTETKRDAVYVVDTASGNAFTAPIEDYVTPMLCYPLPMNRYYDVENFVIGNRVVNEYKGQKIEDLYKRVISFSYIDLSERENTMSATTPYEFKLDLEGYGASDTAINACLYNLYSPTLTRTVKFAPTEQDLIDYGFWKVEVDENGAPVDSDKTTYQIFSKYFLSYDFEVLNDKGELEQTIRQNILISDRDYKETGKYYVYTTETAIVKDANGKDVVVFDNAYNFIAEADGYMFDFLLWDEYDWVNPSYVDQNIAFLERIELISPEYSAIFDIDNSASDQSNGINSNMIKISASQNGGAVRETFDYYDNDKALDLNGYYWRITSTDIKVIEYKTGKEAEIKKDIAYYDYNKLDSQVLCRTGYIKYADEWVEVTADHVNIYAPGSEDTPGELRQSIMRYDSDLWRKFYQSLLYASLEGSYELTDEEEADIISKPENLLLTMKIDMKDAESAGGTEVKKVYKFYKIDGSSRKAYIMISNDGGVTFNGGFYVYRNKVDKFMSDSQKFFNNEIIVPDAKR